MRELYEQRAEQQYAKPKALPDPRLDRKFARICELVRKQLPTQAFLDAGCGDGRYLAALRPALPERLAGVDISERILSTAGRGITHSVCQHPGRPRKLESSESIADSAAWAAPVAADFVARLSCAR